MSEWRFLISCCISSLAACQNPPLAILAIFKARHMLDCSSCTWPPCLTIVADMLKTYMKLVAASEVRSSYYLNHRRLFSVHHGPNSLFRPLPGTFLPNFICENPRTDNIMMFHFTDCVDKSLSQPWRFPGSGSDELVTQLLIHPSGTFYWQLTTVYFNMELVPSHCILHFILAASGFTSQVWMCILGHIFVGCICCIPVD